MLCRILSCELAGLLASLGQHLTTYVSAAAAAVQLKGIGA